MKLRFLLLVAAVFVSGTRARAAMIYSNLQDLAIPTTFDGVYLDLDTGVTNTSSFTGWDINPFFGGAGIGNSAAFQPVRVGGSNLDAVLNLAAGSLISSSLTFASGSGGSGNPGHEHIGLGLGQFQVGVEGYLGFKFTKNDGMGPRYGWMRVTLTNDAGGALIKDWGYDDSGSTIVIGGVRQSAAVGNLQTVTLSPGSGESFSLASLISDTGGNTNSVLKTGAGTTTLTATNTYTGTTTVTAGILVAGGLSALENTSGIVVSGGTFRLGASDVVNNAATVTLSGGSFATGGFSEGIGGLVLTANSILDFDLGSGSQLLFAFAGSHAGGTLSIQNWSGRIGLAGRATDDRLLFTGITTDFTSRYAQSSVSFNGVNGYTAIQYDPTHFEIVAIPEPSAAVLGLLGFAGWRARRRPRSPSAF